MLSQYLEKALGRACIEKGEEGIYIATIPGFSGPWGYGDTPQEALKLLREVFEEWLVIALRADDELPELEGVSLNFGGKRWHEQRAAVS